MDISVIGAVASTAGLVNTQQAAEVSVLKKAMAQEAQAAELVLKMAPPPSGSRLDLLA